MGDRLFFPAKGDEHEVDFSDTREFAVKRWEDAVVAVKLLLGNADREKISEPRDWQTLSRDVQKRSMAATTTPTIRRQLNHMQPLPRAIATVVNSFIGAINPLQTDFNVLWGLLDINIELSCRSTEKLIRTAGWSKKLRSVIELFNRCLDVCEDKNEARYTMVDVLEYLLSILGDSVSHLRRCPTDSEAANQWKTLEPRINEYLTDMELAVRHLNDITSYSLVNLDRQVKNLSQRHATVPAPEEYANFPIFMVTKKRNEDFYGRDDELKRINNYLDFKGNDNLLRTYTIYGRRGVGKTDIALQYAHTNPAGFDAIFWIQCETSITLRQSFTDMAIALNLPGADRNGHHEENQLAVQTWLKTTARTWLMIFDNAERESILRGYWPVGANGAILITSRKYYNFTFDAQRRGDTIKPFTEPQSWDLLMKLLGPVWQDLDRKGLIKSSEDRAARDLLANIGGLALAIQQAAQLIKNHEIGGTTIASTYEFFKEQRKGLPERQSGDRSQTVLSLDTLWSMTFSNLSRNARDLLSVLSLLSPDGILIDLFLPRNQRALEGKLSFCKQHPDHVDEKLQATLSNVIRPPQALQAAIRELVNSKLIKQEGRELWAHRVVQEAMNYHSFSELQAYFDSASALVYEAFPQQMNGNWMTTQQRSACLAYISHGAFLSLQFSKYHRTGAKQTLRGSMQFISLLSNCAWYLYEVSDYEICLRIVETAWVGCEDKESLEYAQLCNVAGCAYYELNKLGDCRKHWLIFSKIHKEKLDDKSLERSASYHNMGNLESASGNQEVAMEYFNKAIEIRMAAGDEAASLLANSYLCLSRPYFLLGKYEESFSRLAESEALFLRIAGADAHFMAHVHYAYGNVELAQKKFASAKRSYDTSLRIALATAAIHPITAAAYYSLGCVEFAEKHLDKAKEYLNKALQIAQLRSPNRDDGTMARILWKTSVVLADYTFGTYQKEATEMGIRADVALRKLTGNGEGGVVALDDDGNADPKEIEDAYDALVPGFFR